MNYYGPNVPLPYEVNHPHDVDGVPQGNVLWEFCPLETDIDRRGQQPGERTPYRAPDTLTVVSTNMQDGLAPVRVEAQNGPIQNEPDRTAAVQAYAGRLVKIGADIIHFTEASPEKKRTADGEALENGPKDEPEIDQRLLDPETGIFKDYYAVVMDEADGDDRRDRHTAVVLVRRGLRVELAALRAGARNVLRLSTFIGTTAITMYLDHAPDRPAATRADHIAAIAAILRRLKRLQLKRTI